MERPPRNFKGIWIPKEIWESEQLSILEKVLFVEIQSLDNERGCFASNAYFGSFFDVHPRRIAAHVASLKAKGFITVKVENYNERVIHVTGRYAHVPDSEFRRMRQDKAELIHRMTLRGRGGMTKTS